MRVISIGTGQTLPEYIHPTNTSLYEWLDVLGTLLTTVEEYTHQYLLRQTFKKEDYHRFDAYFTATENYKLDAVNDTQIESLIDYG